MVLKLGQRPRRRFMRFNEIGVHLIRVNPGHICASHLSSHDHYFNHRHTILPLLLSIEITSTYLPTPILHVYMYMAHTIVKKRYRTMIQCTCTMTSKSCNSGEGEDNKITSFLHCQKNGSNNWCEEVVLLTIHMLFCILRKDSLTDYCLLFCYT